MIVTDFVEQGNALRSIRSFVRRKGRLSTGQARALNAFWEKWSLPSLEAPYTVESLSTIFGRVAPFNLEIGCGNGTALLRMAQQRLEENFLGVDVYQPGLGACLSKIETHQLTNVRLIEGDIIPLLLQQFVGPIFTNIFIWFPDPWPKTRHHKRRLITTRFLNLLAQRLLPGGRLWIATDWEPYALQILEAARSVPSLKNFAVPGPYLDYSIRAERTRFERKGIQFGHQIRELGYIADMEKDSLHD